MSIIYCTYSLYLLQSVSYLSIIRRPAVLYVRRTEVNPTHFSAGASFAGSWWPSPWLQKRLVPLRLATCWEAFHPPNRRPVRGDLPSSPAAEGTDAALTTPSRPANGCCLWNISLSTTVDRKCNISVKRADSVTKVKRRHLVNRWEPRVLAGVTVFSNRTFSSVGHNQPSSSRSGSHWTMTAFGCS